ncbi:lipid II-degrading bacteriocin [Paracidovorax avenae]|uniref:lipid II-degrading bacteriocin n=1 Tax=Paracidovorax avenae TaxID=80867 RepID=UPI001AD81AF4|nr:lipid II-degrading bacteriocin [Paracidovorax avenae]
MESNAEESMDLSRRRDSGLISGDFRAIHATRRRQLLTFMLASGAGLARVPVAKADEGTLPEVTVTGEIEIAGEALGIDVHNQTGAPGDDFFAEIAGYLNAAMETADFYIGMVKKWLEAEVSTIVNQLKPYSRANVLQGDRPDATAYISWRDAAVEINRGAQTDFTVIHASKPTAPFAGLAHYMLGSGEDVTTSIESMSLNVDLGKIGINGATTNAIPLTDFIDAHTQPGEYAYSSNPFGYATYPDNWFTGKFIGNFSMTVEGVLTRNEDGSWEFRGNASAAIPDVYDANPSNYRDPTNEDWTALLRRIPGRPYNVNISGSLPLHYSGR